jgi:hypothetical protein
VESLAKRRHKETYGERECACRGRDDVGPVVRLDLAAMM